MLRIGLNPYGLTSTLGLQRTGLEGRRVGAGGLEEFVTIGAAIGARCLEFDFRWLLPLGDLDLVALADRCRARGTAVLCSAWLRHEAGETLDDVIRVARLTGAAVVRLHLTPVLAGARAAMGAQWPAVLAHARATLLAAAPKAASVGLTLAIENHQDLGSEELVALSEEAGPNVGVVLDTGNPFAVGEDPVAFTARVAHRLQHVHLKDYQAQFTDEGVRLIRCAVGDGCVPLGEIVDVLSRAGRGDLTASLELGALEARHVRLFAPDWWEGYPPRDGRELGVAIGRLRRGCLADEVDARTPWERSAPDAEVIAYEREGLRRSVDYVRAQGWMPEHTS